METFLIGVAFLVLAMIFIIILAITIVWIFRKLSKPQLNRTFIHQTSRFKAQGEKRELIFIGAPAECLPKKWNDMKRLIEKMGCRLGTLDEINYALEGEGKKPSVVIGYESDSQKPTLYRITPNNISDLHLNEVHYCLVRLPQ